MISARKMFLSLIVIFSLVQFITCPDTETATPNASSQTKEDDANKVTQTATAADGDTKQTTTKQTTTKQTTTKQHTSNASTGDGCAVLKPLKWIASEPAKLFWNSMSTVGEMLVNISKPRGSDNGNNGGDDDDVSSNA